MINIIKESGEIAPYNEQRVRDILARVGATEEEQTKVLQYLNTQLYERIKTSEIYHIVFKQLDAIKPHLASRFSLKQSIAELGPSGYPFEKFIAGILAEFGYKTETNLMMKGKCVVHEVDVVAYKDDTKGIIEAKFHKNTGYKTNIQTVLYVDARYKDIKSTLPKGEKSTGWLITNAKFSADTINYGECAGLKLIGWDYPNHIGLRVLIDKSGLQPITTLQNLSTINKTNLLANNIVFCRDIAKIDKNKLKELTINTDVDKLIESAKLVCQTHTHK